MERFGEGCRTVYRLWVPQHVDCLRRNAHLPARVIVGIGGGITKVAAPALLHEIAHPRLRATFGTLVSDTPDELKIQH